MKKQRLIITLIILITTLIILITTLSGCSFEDEADVVSHNISKEADNFNIYRDIKIINNQTDVTILEFKGWCSINVDKADNQLEITYRVGENEYYKDFIGLNNRTSYVITQINGKNVSRYNYEWMYHSKGDLIPISIKDNDK